ncbi:hypothetical protein [Nostoc sp. DedQUE08]|uniref:hypothetical protein n=1 Tax=Nostoc sp. DedQUE08 TaxID=3075393 RepID=UPI003A101891
MTLEYWREYRTYFYISLKGERFRERFSRYREKSELLPPAPCLTSATLSDHLPPAPCLTSATLSDHLPPSKVPKLVSPSLPRSMPIEQVQRV